MKIYAPCTLLKRIFIPQNKTHRLLKNSLLYLKHALRHHPFRYLRETLSEIMEYLNVKLLTALRHARLMMFQITKKWNSTGLPMIMVFWGFQHFLWERTQNQLSSKPSQQLLFLFQLHLWKNYCITFLGLDNKRDNGLNTKMGIILSQNLILNHLIYHRYTYITFPWNVLVQVFTQSPLLHSPLLTYMK